ncbi:MAG: energy-coupled thiamine transporter ThiT [Bacilli bacterium]
MNKSTNIIRYIAIGLGYLATLFFFLPLFEANGNVYIGAQIILGFKTANFDAFSLIAYLIPAAAATLLLLRSKYSESLSMMLFLLSGLIFIVIPDFTAFFNDHLGLSIILTTYVIPIVFSFTAALLALTLSNLKNNFSTYQIVEMAMLVSLAIVLDLPGFKIRIGSAGGSIGFTMVPLFILVLRQGSIKGFIGTGIVYGFATCILDGWGLVTYPFDYLLGYGSLALLGIFKPLILSNHITKFNVKGMLFMILGVVIAIAGRLMASTLSGVIYYEVDFWGSLVYNTSYILPSAGIVLVLLVGLYDPLIRVNKMVNSRLG